MRERMPAAARTGAGGCSWYLLLLRGELGQLWVGAGPGWVSSPQGQCQCVVVLEGAALMLVVTTEFCFLEDRKPTVCCKSALFLKLDLCFPGLCGFGSI